MSINIVEVSYKWNGGFSTRPRTDYIALHHAEATTCSPADVHSWHLSNGWTGIGYHFFVRKDGTIYRGRPLHVTGSHVKGMNNCSVGVCAEGSYNGKDNAMPQAQFSSIVELCKYLKTIYPSAKIVGHREIGDSNCPGKNYPLQKVKDAVANSNYTTNYMTKKTEEEIDMEEVKKLQEQVTALRKANMVYNYMDDNMPSWAKPTIQKLMDKGYIKGDDTGKLGLTMDMIKIFVVNDRAGLYD